MKVPSAKKELLSFYPDVVVEGSGSNRAYAAERVEVNRV
jgi:hypothetical protein